MDSIPPVIVKSVPENYSTNFKGDEFRIYFDEYVKFKDLTSELIISPPMEYAPTITPLSTSKYIKVKILDTLRENTTYAFNFGKSIVDNNESNEFEYFKYVFSTGSYIDSLKLSGTIKDVKILEAEPPISVLLYQVNEEFNDSIVFKEKPMYVTATKDSTNTFELTNLKAGKYLLLGLKEGTRDFMFQPEKDKIAFEKQHIVLPTDSSYTLTLFKEEPKYKIARPKHESKNHILFGYTGKTDSIELDLLSQVPEDFQYRVYQDLEKDSLHYWFRPNLEVDSLQLIAKHKDELDTLTVRVRDLYKDSLTISVINDRVIKLGDTVKIKVNTPIVSLDSEKIKIIDRDSVVIPYTTQINRKYNLANIIFETVEAQDYSLEILPGAIADLYEETNDTLVFRTGTKAASDYGSLELTLSNAKSFPIIVELVDSRFEVIDSKYIESDVPVNFQQITPGKYYVRICHDENENRKWDSGNFLEGTQPETIIYYPSLLDVRANWSLVETFILD